MRNFFKLSTAFLLLIVGASHAQIGVGTTTPDASSVLDVSSTTKGLLIPRMTTGERNLIASPAKGLTIFNLTTNQLEFNSGTTTDPFWSAANSSTGWSLTGNAGTTAATNFIGTTDNVDFSTRTNNIERLIIKNNGFIGVGTTAPLVQFDIRTTDHIGLAVTRGNANLSATSSIAIQKTFNSNPNIITAVPSNVIAGSIRFRAANGTAYGENASISSLTTENQTTTGSGGNLTFSVTSNGTTFLSERMRIDQNGVGIGTSNIQSQLDLKTSSQSVLSATRGNSNGAVGTNMFIQRTMNNNPDLHTAVLNNVPVANMFFRSSNGTSYAENVSIRVVTTELQTATGSGGKLDFFTTANGTTTPISRMQINHDGNVGIGVNAPVQKFEVDGAIKVGNTATAPPTAGTIRFNSTNNKFEGYDGTVWQILN